MRSVTTTHKSRFVITRVRWTVIRNAILASRRYRALRLSELPCCLSGTVSSLR
ncbi:MAG: hypothetical protein H0A75_03975 [Candidatus Methanofishera endochildressiae]|uniref:Uncharacterized protein n=1 Tax=Candidatus Methanofishera endochildressiae TaxID=2738884 RepID=A0A7Z0SDL8_9GAMM|nr:hypothetical protein [Candidatus Methanofishera endochildressiae]